ncbi:jupiter microtubule associated homolog 1a [Amia ocellicauda]|uniref:jupiter microtubule associated homolog 1a n=1 Tax=Amia ocellicauda TaxID=2972642 RepID=UPI003464D441
MTTTTTFQGMDPGSKNSSRVLRPPGGGSNISFGNGDEEGKAQNTRKNRTASNIFAEPEDPHAHRRNNPPGGKPSGIFSGEPSAPLRRCHTQPAVQSNSVSEEAKTGDGEMERAIIENSEEVEIIPEQKEEAPQPSAPTVPAAAPGGRRNPPGGKSSLILG